MLNEHQNDLGGVPDQERSGASVPRIPDRTCRPGHPRAGDRPAKCTPDRGHRTHPQRHRLATTAQSVRGGLLEPVEPAELVRQTVELSSRIAETARHRRATGIGADGGHPPGPASHPASSGQPIHQRGQLREAGVAGWAADHAEGFPPPRNGSRGCLFPHRRQRRRHRPPRIWIAIFALGFTTRNDGHGIGLHGAANMAREMGGSLTARSGGLGCGAVFTLTIPVTGAESPSDSVRAARSDERVLPAGLTSEVPDARVV